MYDKSRDIHGPVKGRIVIVGMDDDWSLFLFRIVPRSVWDMVKALIPKCPIVFAHDSRELILDKWHAIRHSHRQMIIVLYVLYIFISYFSGTY